MDPNIINIFLPFMDFKLFILIALGTFIGIYVGAIPGLSGTMAVSLLISFTFGWETNSALAIMIGIYTGSVYGGSRSAILLNIPGAPAAVATALDGYPLAQKGEAGRAIGIVTVQSFIGGFIGIAFLAFATPLVSRLALSFAPIDYFLLSMMGLMLVGTLGSKSKAKGFLMGGLGLILGMVGMDPFSGKARLTFGQFGLLSGVDYITAMIGLFGASEVLVQILNRDAPTIKQKVDKIIPSFRTVLDYLPLTLRSGVIGTIVGALPGAGGDIAALLSYDLAKRTVRKPKVPFGEGAIEGLVAPETANNAVIGGAFIPMLTLGIPGDSVTAIIIGALFIHGLKPGPMMMAETPHLFWYIVGACIIANIAMLVFGLTGVKLFVKIVDMPKSVLYPVIIALSVIGAYSVNANVVDIFWMLGFGMVGYILKTYDYPVAPMVLGIILANMVETNLRRAVMAEGSILGTARILFNSPITIVLLVFIVLMLVAQSKWFLALLDRKSPQTKAE